jgi:hypothetical protein
MKRSFRVALALAAGASVCACSDPPANKIAACEGDPSAMGVSTSALTLQDRKVVGAAAKYQPDAAIAVRENTLRTSMVARRAMAWDVVGRVLAPTPLGEAKLAQQFGQQPTVPAWHTWYGRDDFERVFKKLYQELGAPGRRVHQAFDASTIAAGVDWNSNALDELSTTSWPESRYLEYLSAATTDERAHGFGGISRVSYSPGTMTHLLGSYSTMLSCSLQPEPAAFASEPIVEGRAVSNSESLSMAECDWHVVGPFVSASDAEFAVHSQGDGDADIYIRRGQAPDLNTFDCKSDGKTSDEDCSIDGGGPIYVGVLASKASAVKITVDYREADVRKPACLANEMPRDAAMVKADWHRAQFGATLNVYDTSGPRMSSRLSKAGGFAWGPGDGQADPGPRDIYSVTLPNGNAFRMSGLHIMTKELDHWVWITLWWSPTPDSDFGADRPAAIATLPGPWKNYKMCVVTDYVEGDADPRGGATGSLGDSLAAVYRGKDAPSWCSNPYLEIGERNANTNCIGCHQHGGTSLKPEAILSDFPAMGSTRLRNNFFTDYSWAIRGGGGEDITALIKAEADYWAAGDK